MNLTSQDNRCIYTQENVSPQFPKRDKAKSNSPAKNINSSKMDEIIERLTGSKMCTVCPPKEDQMRAMSASDHNNSIESKSGSTM
jgi:hypothetical protein